MEKDNKDEKVGIPMSELTKLNERLAEMEKRVTDAEAKSAGMEELLANKPSTEGEPKLREKRSYEPQFRTVRIRKYPIAGDINNLGYVIGWSSRGAYHKIESDGIAPQKIDYVDVQFLGHERNDKGQLKFEAVRLLDLLNRGEQIHCKILDTKITNRKVPTGEEIDISVWDPIHGLVQTGEKIDGYVTFSDRMLTVQIPGVSEPVEIDAVYCNR